MTVLKDKDVITRKPQRCWGCAREFPIGSKLRYTVQTNDGFSSSYWCNTCNKYWYQHMHYEDEISFGDLKANDFETWEQIRISVEGS